MHLTSGDRLGPYTITARLGAGGMGEVFRAHDGRLERDVAIKVLGGAFAADADRVRRFTIEAQATGALNHPNILAVYDTGTHEGAPYLVTELLEGETLRARMDAERVPLSKALDLARQVASGLAAAHAKGITHRDIKPENLFVTTDGRVKILDFGLAKQGGATGDQSTVLQSPTSAGMVLGTAGYMSPEQVRGEPADPRSDIFSFGVVLYELLAGRRPFVGDTAVQTMSAVLTEDPPEIEITGRPLPPALDRVVRHCLEKKADERFQSARDLAFALDALAGSAASRTSSETTPLPAGAGQATRRTRTVPLIAVAVVLALGVGWAAASFTAPTATTWTYTVRTRKEQTLFNSRFMPDGETAIISAARSGNSPSLFESRGSQAAPRPFGPDATHLLSVSSSGELLVLTNARFMGHRSFRGTLGRMAVDGTPRAIAEDVREADWLPDGSDFVVVRDQGRTDVLEFPMGTPVYTAPGYISTPRVSPDGRRVAFMEHPLKWDNRGWVKVVDRAGVVITLAGEHSGQEGLVWSPDGVDVIFARAFGDDYQVYAVDAEGGAAPRPWLSAPGTLFIHDRRTDGSLLISRERNFGGAVGRAATGEPEHDFGPSDDGWGASLSLDGKFVLMTDARGDLDYTVVLVPIEGGPATRLGEGDAQNLSPDGAWASAIRHSTDQCVVYPTGAGAPVVIDTAGAACTGALFSGQGSTLAVFMAQAAGSGRVRMKMQVPGGALEPMPLPSGMTDLLGKRPVSPAGWTLGRDAQSRWLVAAPDGVVTEARGIIPRDRFLRWSADSRSLTVANGFGPTLVFRVDWRTGQRTQIEAVMPDDRPGLLGFGLQDFVPETGAYVAEYVRRTSALYVAERR